MRYAHITTGCGCSMPGLARAAARGIDLAKAEAQGATPGRRRPVGTNVARYVEAKAPGLARKLRKVLRAAGKRAAGIAAKAYAETLRKDDGTAALIEEILRNLGSSDLGADLLGQLANAMLAAFRRAAALGATQVGITLGDDALKQVDVAALEYARLHGAELIRNLAGTTDDAMRSLLVRAIGEGMAPATLAKEIQALGAFSDYRAETIARTELAFAHVRGNVAGWRATGEVDRKRWLLADTHPEPDICDEAADMGIIGLDEEFAPGVLFPPDSHPRCLCDCLPVLRDLPPRAPTP